MKPKTDKLAPIEELMTRIANIYDNRPIEISLSLIRDRKTGEYLIILNESRCLTQEEQLNLELLKESEKAPSLTKMAYVG